MLDFSLLAKKKFRQNKQKFLLKKQLFQHTTPFFLKIHLRKIYL